jgi:hypothetical protein
MGGGAIVDEVSGYPPWPFPLSMIIDGPQFGPYTIIANAAYAVNSMFG